MQQAGEDGIAKEVLRSEIAQRRAETFGIRYAAFAIFGRLVISLRKPGAERGGRNIERILGFVEKEQPFLLRRERRRCRGSIRNRLELGITPRMRSWFRPSDDCAHTLPVASR